LSPLNEKPKPTTLDSADALLRAVASELETNVNTPTKEWSHGARRVSMRQLCLTANKASAFLDDCVEKDLRIKNAGKLIHCLERISWTANDVVRQYDYRAPSIIQGRSSLKEYLACLKPLLGNGVALEENHVLERPPRPQPPVITTPPPAPPAKEIRLADLERKRPYTIQELVVLHNLSSRTITRLYENEPDVLILQSPRAHQEKIGRHYRTIRVPEHVYRRVKHRLEKR
jgi:hypothetical protein